MKPSDAYQAAQGVYDTKNPMYAEQWRDYEILSLADIVRGKAVRVKQAIKREDWEDAKEEALDTINFMAFCWCRIMEEENETP